MTKQTKAYLALIYICIAWGTTYLAIRVGVTHYPAFLYAGLRQVFAGLLIMVLALALYKRADISWANIKHHAMVGFLLITMGNGLVSWAERSIPSGVAALICSMMPISAVVIGVTSSSREKINGQIIFGLALGVSGVALIFKDNIADLTNTTYLMSMLITFIATVSWAYGSVFNKKRPSVINPFFNAGMQLFIGGAILVIASPAVDTFNGESFFQPEVVGSMIYLILVGSLGAYTAYLYSLKELPVGIVTLYAYVNPLVAVVLGYFILNEQLTIYTALAFVTIVTGIYIVNYGYRRQQKKLERQQAAANNIHVNPVPQSVEPE